VAPARRGITANTDVIVDSKDHAFITEPMLALVYRIGELTKQDPFLALYAEYLAETNPTKSAALQAKLDKLLPVQYDETRDEALAKSSVPYNFLSDFKKHQ
jgi:hypothetical protein